MLKKLFFIKILCLLLLIGSSGTLQAQWIGLDKVQSLSDVSAYDWFGHSVDIDGEYAIVSAPFENSGGVLHAGAAYIFKWNESLSKWEQQAKLVANDLTPWHGFGWDASSVSISGDYAVIGAYENLSGMSSGPGAAYIFKRNGVNWTQQAKIQASDPQHLAHFGFSVSIDGDYVIVGAPNHDEIEANSGAAYVFKRNGVNWIEQAKLTTSDATLGDLFGYSVSISGEYVVIGMPNADISHPDEGPLAGLAYIFKRNGTNWTEQTKLKTSDYAPPEIPSNGGYTGFGHSVSIDESYVVIGAYLHASSSIFPGSAYVFYRDGGTWEAEAKLEASDPVNGSAFGEHVSIDGNKIIVGAFRHSSHQGAAYVFKQDGTDWTEQSKLTSWDSQATEGHWFGHSVAISGDHAIVGAPLDVVQGNPREGVAYFFGVFPEINIQGNGNDIVDGSSSPSIIDDTDFGEVIKNDSKTVTYTIYNTGGTDLIIPSIDLVGSHASNFAVGEDIVFPLTIFCGDSATFTLTFTPSALGTRTATVIVNNNDPDEAIYDFVVEGIGVSPEINIQGNNNNIVDGSTSPSFGNDTDFGTLDIGTSKTVTYTIQNIGSRDLTIDDIEVIGPQASSFISAGIITPSIIASNNSITFTLTFTPSGIGLHRATVIVHNNDCDEGIYDFAVQGQSLASENCILEGQWLTFGNEINGETSGDLTGRSVSLSTNGSILAVGSPSNDVGGSNSGQVRIYKHGGSWVLLGAPINGIASGDNSGFSVDLSSDGTRVAIGSPFNDAGGLNSGQVRIYKYGGGWGLMGSPINGLTGDRSGYSVSLSADGTRVAIGSPYSNVGGSNSGQVRVYEYLSGIWTPIGTIIMGSTGDEMGRAVSLSADGTRLAVALPFSDFAGSASGQVQVYEYIDNTWILLGTPINGVAAGDITGESLALSGDGVRLAIGSPRSDVSGTDAGQVRVYEYQVSNNDWVQIGGSFHAEGDFDLLGNKVDISYDGTRLMTSAPLNDANGIDAGQVKIYGYCEGTWTQICKAINGDKGDESGTGIALSGDGTKLAIGSPRNDISGTDAGQVKVFELGSPPHIEVSTLDGTIIEAEGVYDVFGLFCTQEVTFTVQNLGSNTLYPQGVTLNGSTAFTLTSDLPTAIPASSSASFTVRFTATSGLQSTYVTFEDGCTDFRFQLRENSSDQWVRGSESSGTDIGEDIIADCHGDSYIIGSFENSIGLFSGMNITSYGDKDIFLAKVNPAGEAIWIRQMGGLGEDAGLGLALDEDNEFVYITGYVSGLVNFDGIPLSGVGGTDAFLAKYDWDGNLIWVRNMGGTADDKGSAVAFDAGTSRAYVTGIFRNQANFDFSTSGGFLLNAQGLGDVFVTQHNDTGDLLWAQAFGGIGEDGGEDIVIDEAGSPYFTGFFWNKNPNPGTTSSSGSASPPYIWDFGSFGSPSQVAFVSKLSTGGSLQWSHIMGSTFGDSGLGLHVEDGGSGRVLTTGYFGTSSTQRNLFVGSFHKGIGSMQAWNVSNAIPGAFSEGRSISSDASGKLYVTGRFKGSVNFGLSSLPLPLNSNANSEDIFLLSFDYTSGTPFSVPTNVAATSIGGSGQDIGNAIWAGQSLYLTGSFESSVNFLNIATLNALSPDSEIFLLKFSLNGLSIGGYHNTLFIDTPSEDVTLKDNLSNLETSWRIVPNPSQGRFSVQGFTANTLVKYQLMNSQGRVFLEGQKTVSQNLDFYLNNLSTGAYFLHLSSEENSKVLRLVIE